MPININGLGTGSLGTDKTRGQEQASKTGVGNSQSSENKAQPSQDAVKLSPEVKILKKLETEIQGMADVDQNKIHRIKSALKNGEYQINYDRLASAIEKFESDI